MSESAGVSPDVKEPKVPPNDTLDSARSLAEGARANVKTLQGFIGILMGVGLANLVREFITRNKLNDGTLIWSLGPGPLLLVAAGLSVFVRFYHGNMRIMEELYQPGTEHTTTVRVTQMGDWVVTLSQAIILAALGLFVTQPVNYQWLIVFVYLIDITWLLISQFGRSRGDDLTTTIAKRWAAINGLSLVLLAVVQGMYLLQAINVGKSEICFAAIIIIGAVVDYVLNGKFYFPHGRV